MPNGEKKKRKKSKPGISTGKKNPLPEKNLFLPNRTPYSFFFVHPLKNIPKDSLGRSPKEAAVAKLKKGYQPKAELKKKVRKEEGKGREKI